MSTEFDYYKTGDDGSAGIAGANWAAQTFTASASYTIKSVKLLLYRLVVGGPGTVTVTINTTSGGKPTGSILCSGTTDGNTLTTSSSGEWREITFGAGSALTSTTVYSIVVSAPAASYNLRWRDDSSSPTYTGGSNCYSSNSGSTWTADTGTDMMFDTYGDASATYVNLSGTGGGIGAGFGPLWVHTDISIAGTGGGIGGGFGPIVVQTFVNVSGTCHAVASGSGFLQKTIYVVMTQHTTRLVAIGNDQFFYEDV